MGIFSEAAEEREWELKKRIEELEAELSALRAIHMVAGGEPHWLTKDFNVLYRHAHQLVEVCSGRGDGRPHGPLKALEAQLERLKPAFTDTEEVRRLLREKP